MEDRHRNQIAAVVDEWDEAERRYNKLKGQDPVAAEEKMKSKAFTVKTLLSNLIFFANICLIFVKQGFLFQLIMH